MKGLQIILTSSYVLASMTTTTAAFQPRPLSSRATTTTRTTGSTSSALFSAKEEAAALLERARKMRAEAAALEGSSVEKIEEEARVKRQNAAASKERKAAARIERKAVQETRSVTDGTFLNVPETADEQVTQAKAAVERAYAEGIKRQVVRFALVPEEERLNEGDQLWPGGAQEMYRRAAGPMSLELVRQIRPVSAGSERGAGFSKPPNVTAQDIWDFDGSALVTAQSVAGPAGDVQAMVFANTDNKYTTDIAAISETMGERLFVLVNPFWRDVESWGFNILAPGAKKKAQEVIFDGGFQETYVLLEKSVRGEDCIALKAYPYDWQLYAYAETDYWPYDEFITHLGSTTEEPKGSDFNELMEQRDEFKMSKNMRQMQRMLNKDK